MIRLSDDDSSTSTLSELRELPVEPDWDVMESRLLRAFGLLKATLESSKETKVAKEASKETKKKVWEYAAAAVVVLAGAITFYPTPARNGTVAGKPTTPPTGPKPPAETVAEPRHSTPIPPVSPAKRKGRAPKTAAVRQQPADATTEDFVALPSAVGLPAFESGHIVRIEVPLAALPVYGIDLVPDAASTPVQADFLVGQDGVPRAIRLAANSQRE